MALKQRILVRFECGHERELRKPNTERVLIRALRLAKCLVCHPDHYREICGGCHLPLTAVGHHRDGLCNTCTVRELRYGRAAPVTIPHGVVPLQHG